MTAVCPIGMLGQCEDRVSVCLDVDPSSVIANISPTQAAGHQERVKGFSSCQHARKTRTLKDDSISMHVTPSKILLLVAQGNYGCSTDTLIWISMWWKSLGEGGFSEPLKISLKSDTLVSS